MPSRIIETFVTELKADGTQAKKELERNVIETKSWANRVAGIVALSVSTIGAAAYARKVVEATQVQESAMRQLQQGLITTNGAVGQSFEDLVSKAGELQKVTNFGDEQLIQAQSQLVTFTKITNDEFNRTLELSADLSTRFNTDLKGSVLQLGKALNDPVKNLSALSRAGIQFSDQQKELIKQLFETGQVAESQRLILAELEAQFGGSARAARNTFEGALKSLGNAAGDLLEADSLGGITVSIERLTGVLQDPSTVNAAKSLANGIISAFASVTSTISSTVNLVQFLGEELAAAFNGVNADDIVRIDEQIREVETLINGSLLDKVGRLRFFGKDGIVEYYDEEELKQRLSELKQARDEFFSQSQGRQGNAVVDIKKVPEFNTQEAVAGVVTINKEFDKLSDNLQRQIDLYGVTSDAARLRYDLENGLIENISRKQADLLVSKQHQLDALNQQEESLKQSLENESRRLEEEERRRTELLSDVSRIEESILTEEERRQIAFENRNTMLEEALQSELITHERYHEILRKLEEKSEKERFDIRAKGFSSLLSIADRYYSGMQGKEAGYARVAIQIGKVLLDSKQRDALKSIYINTRDAAMGSYKALAGIPFVGPVLGAAAAGAVLVSGAAYGAEVAGIAHGGLDYVPKEQTYLLDRGERVLSPQQNQDFTRFIENNEATQPNIVVNINEAPGVQNTVNVEQQGGQTVVVIEQQLRDLVREELEVQSGPGGILDGSYAL